MKMTTATPYDDVAYPTAIFQQTHPDRLAVLATLHGLEAPDIRTARVLEIGCGNGMNLLAFAAGLPDAEFHGFDLAETPIARGNELAALGGPQNVRLDTLDIMKAREVLPERGYDYIIAHGVYAWVPDFVREEMMRVVGHCLSDRGVAFVSYNAKPGGHIRMIMRDMLRHELQGIEESDAKIAATLAELKRISERPHDNDPVKIAVKAQADAMLERPSAVLFHDELGGAYHPQSITEVVAAADAVGLRFLTDAGRNRHLDGYLIEPLTDGADPEAAIVRQAQSDDYSAMRFFRQTLLVRAENRPQRQIDTAQMQGLWISTELTRDEKGVFHSGKDSLEIKDDALANTLEQLSSMFPQRLPVADHVDGDDRRRAVLSMFSEWYVDLCSGDEPFALDLPERPCTSPLIRAQIARGDTRICTLDHRLLSIEQAELRALLLAADGTRTVAELQQMDEHGFPADQIPAALAASARRALICR